MSLDTKNRISIDVNEATVLRFFKRYPAVKHTMKQYIGTKRQTIDSYVDWLKQYGSHPGVLGAYSETVDSPSFGSKTFWKFNWDGVGGYAELYQYLIDKKKGLY